MLLSSLCALNDRLDAVFLAGEEKTELQALEGELERLERLLSDAKEALDKYNMNIKELEANRDRYNKIEQVLDEYTIPGLEEELSGLTDFDEIRSKKKEIAKAKKESTNANILKSYWWKELTKAYGDVEVSNKYAQCWQNKEAARRRLEEFKAQTRRK